MGKNFAGQNLNGRSFREQDLRGADFSGCELKSCDFTNADLTDAKFCRARMGVNRQRTFLKWILAFALGVAGGFLTWFLSSTFLFSFDEFHSTLQRIYGIRDPEKESLILILTVLSYPALVSLTILGFQDWRIVIWCNLAIAIMGAWIAIMGGARPDLIVIMGVTTVTALLTGMIAVAVAVAGVAALAGEIVVVAVAVLMGTGMESVGVGAIILCQMWMGWYLNRQALKLENQGLETLYVFTLRWRCLGGTQFARAVLAHTDFSESDLAGAHFSSANFQQPDFTGAQNLHFAWTAGTPLEHKKVHLLLTDNQLESRDFSHLNLRGLSFKGLVLTGCNFYHADLSEADFSGCDLTETDLSEAMVYGTRFTHATMTGAIIGNWGMDKQTQFDNVICDFVYTQSDRSERNPLDGTFFKPGEFSKLYQEIANTVDFIAHSPDELQALLRVIERIKQEGGDIVIQSLERKNESVVVRTQSHDGVDDATRYAEVIARKEKEMDFLQQEKQLLLQRVDLQAQHIDTFTQILSKAVEGPKIMNDHSRHYGNITAQDSAVNLGDASTVSNHIEQVADAELKAALQTLQQLLTDSHLPVIDKQEAHKAVDDLAVISQKPETERKSLARRSLAFLKELQKDLSSVAELGEQYGKLLVKVMAWF